MYKSHARTVYYRIGYFGVKKLIYAHICLIKCPTLETARPIPNREFCIHQAKERATGVIPASLLFVLLVWLYYAASV